MKNRNRTSRKQAVEVSIGIDLGEKTSYVVALSSGGEVLRDHAVRTTTEALTRELNVFANPSELVCVLETGTHSAWISRLVENLGIRCIVANSRTSVLRRNAKKHRKNDREDAVDLAHWGLHQHAEHFLDPIEHRGQAAQVDLGIIRARNTLVELRTKTILTARSLAKSIDGTRLPSCKTDAFHRRVADEIPAQLRPVLANLVSVVGALTEHIETYDAAIEELGEKKYREIKRLTQVHGVGTLTALTFVLTLENAKRFQRSRQVGAFLGLTPGQHESGSFSPQLRITKCGDRYLRKLLVQCAHHILGPFGQPSQLRSFGERLEARGGKNARKRARVAVARKLAVLLHSLWSSGQIYDPQRGVAA